MNVWALVAGGFLIGCVHSSDVVCGERTCPGGTVCDDVRNLCLTPAQATVCNGVATGVRCDAQGIPGICDRGFCEPGCGDSVVDPDEQCDDGNFATHDGCSSRCLVETPTWVPHLSPWSGVTQAAAAYHAQLDRIVIIQGQSAGGYRDEIWHRISGSSDPDTGWRNVTDAFQTGERPSARDNAKVAYDADRGVIVLFGGSHGATQFDDTWEYAVGTGVVDDEGEPVGRWTRLSPTNTPGPRFGALMAYDANLKKTVLLGGIGQDTTMWAWDGASWTPLPVETKPPFSTMYYGMMAFDSLRSRLVVFGGTAPQDRTYEFDGVGWTTVTTAAPPRRRGAAMAFDADRQKIVLFGGTAVGSTSADPYSDTWTYDGQWVRMVTPTTPPGRTWANLVADPQASRLVLVGGTPGNGGEPLSDVWELTSTGWLQRTPRFSPPAASATSAAFAASKRMLWFGGSRTYTDSLPHELWGYDGRRWLFSGTIPVQRWGMNLVVDPESERLLMFGGFYLDTDTATIVPANTLYQRDPSTFAWTEVATAAPSGLARGQAALVVDESTGELVLFGGWTEALERSTLLSDTWTFDGQTWTQRSTGVHPAPTVAAAAAWDPVSTATTLFDSDGETWQYREAAWTRLEVSGERPEGREGAALTWNPHRRMLVLAGGTRIDGTPLDDVWELDTLTTTWRRVFIPGQSPLPRAGFAFGAHHNARALVLFGGSLGDLVDPRLRGDAWSLRYVSPTIDEDCYDGLDTDEDLQADGDDPDCTLPPSLVTPASQP